MNYIQPILLCLHCTVAEKYRCDCPGNLYPHNKSIHLSHSVARLRVIWNITEQINLKVSIQSNTITRYMSWSQILKFSCSGLIHVCQRYIP